MATCSAVDTAVAAASGAAKGFTPAGASAVGARPVLSSKVIPCPCCCCQPAGPLSMSSRRPNITEWLSIGLRKQQQPLFLLLLYGYACCCFCASCSRVTLGAVSAVMCCSRSISRKASL